VPHVVPRGDARPSSRRRLGLAGSIDSLGPASPDLIAVRGDPLQDVDAPKHADTVMKGGRLVERRAAPSLDESPATGRPGEVPFSTGHELRGP
jgi:hypothetical protein